MAGVVAATLPVCGLFDAGDGSPVCEDASTLPRDQRLVLCVH